MANNFVFAWGKRNSNTEFGCICKEWGKVLKMLWPQTHVLSCLYLMSNPGHELGLLINVQCHYVKYGNEIITLMFNPLNPELNPICYLLALLGAHHFLHVSRIRVKLLTFRILMLYIYGAPTLDVSRSHTTTQHSR